MPLVPFKLNQDRRHHIPRQHHKVTNWPDCEASLRQRDGLTVWFTEEAIAAWAAAPRTTRLGDTAEVGVALYRRGFNCDTWHRRGPWRHNHRRVRVTVSDCCVNTVLISKPEQTPQVCMLSLLFCAVTTDLEPML